MLVNISVVVSTCQFLGDLSRAGSVTLLIYLRVVSELLDKEHSGVRIYSLMHFPHIRSWRICSFPPERETLNALQNSPLLTISAQGVREAKEPFLKDPSRVSYSLQVLLETSYST